MDGSSKNSKSIVTIMIFLVIALLFLIIVYSFNLKDIMKDNKITSVSISTNVNLTTNEYEITSVEEQTEGTTEITTKGDAVTKNTTKSTLKAKINDNNYQTTTPVTNYAETITTTTEPVTTETVTFGYEDLNDNSGFSLLCVYRNGNKANGNVKVIYSDNSYNYFSITSECLKVIKGDISDVKVVS